MSAHPGGPGAAGRWAAVEIERHDAEQPVYVEGGDGISDDWLRDQWWRANNPGASAARGVLCAMAAAAILWPALIAAGFWVWSLFA